MQTVFKKLKTGYTLSLLLKSAVLGVSVALFAVGVFVLSFKLARVEINVGYYVLIGCVCALAVGGTAFGVMYKNKKAFARKLDNEYELGEKVQTMLACEGQSGAIIEAQREDALATLSALPKRKVDFKRIWYYIVSCVLGIAMFLTAVLVPAKTNTGTTETPEDLFEVTEFHLTALDQLIEEVKSSELETGLKASCTDVLTGLKQGVTSVNKVGDMKTLVLAAITTVDAAVTERKTYVQLCSSFNSDEEVKYLGDAIRVGIFSYSKNNASFDSYGKVQSVYALLSERIADEFEASTYNKKTEFAGLQQAELAPALTAHKTKIDTAVKTAGLDDGVFKTAFAAFGEKLQTIASSATAGSETAEDSAGGATAEDSAGGAITEEIKENLNLAYGELSGDLNAHLKEQAYNLVMDEFIRARLSAIFALAATELPEGIGADGSSAGGSGSSGGESGDSGDNDDVHGGGAGSGDKQYGSDDEIYDPDTESYVKYGDIIDAYYAKFLEQVANGEVSDETLAAITEYFEKLYGVLDKKEDAA